MPPLRDRALELALVSLAEGPLIPFMLLVGKDQVLADCTIVSPRSDSALSAARRVVRERANDIVEYAIIVDTYLRLEGERTDGLLIEVGTRESAHVTAHPYRRVSGTPTLIGEPIDYERRPSSMVAFDPFTLDWGPITPDFYNREQNHAIHVVNHLLEADNIARTLRFLRARVRNFNRHLPDGAQHTAFFEDRGQVVTDTIRATLADGLEGTMAVRYISETERE
jgi:hypothetical protein